MPKETYSYAIKSTERYGLISFEVFPTSTAAFEKVRQHAKRIRQLLVTTLPGLRAVDQPIYDARDPGVVNFAQNLTEAINWDKFVVAVHEVRKIGNPTDQRSTKRIVVICLRRGETFAEQDFPSSET